MNNPNPVPLQSVLLFQHHQTTTPFSPGTPTVVSSTVAEPKQKPAQEEQEEEEEEQEDEEEPEDEEH